MLELIKKAEEKGLDVIITDGCFYLERSLCSTDKWHEASEYGWVYTTEELTKFEVIETEETKDGFFFITVDCI